MVASQSCVSLDLLLSAPCVVSKITFAILPKSAADFHPKSTREVAARADNKIKYYVPTININYIALYRIHIDSQTNLVRGIKRGFFFFFVLIAAKTQIRA